MMNNTKKIVVLGLFLAMAIIINIAENVFFSFIFIPGIKLGLANVATIFILCYFGYKEMFLVNVTRIILANIITGQLFAMPFTIALFSSAMSMLVLFIFYKINKFSIYGISMIQATFFNFFQIVILSLLYELPAIYAYLPYLLLSGMVTGLLVAFSAKFVLKIVARAV